MTNKDGKLTEWDLQKSLFRHWNSHRYRFLNTFYFENESDYLSFSKNGYCYEAEIKISRSDYFADFEKKRHRIHEAIQANRKYYLERFGSTYEINPTWEMTKEFPELVESEVKEYKWRGYTEQRITTKFEKCCRIQINKIKNSMLPNKFFFAVPENLIAKNEVPDYAGLLYVGKSGVKKIKDAGFIHKDILDPKKVFDKMYRKYESGIIDRIWPKNVRL